MNIVFTAIFPVFALLVLGNIARRIARRTDFMNVEFWRQAERGTYCVLFPCLIFGNLARADLGGRPRTLPLTALVQHPVNPLDNQTTSGFPM